MLDDRLKVRPVQPDEGTLRRYTEEEVERFMEEDKLDAGTAARVRELLRKGKL